MSTAAITNLSVLALNRSYAPVGIVSLKKALKKLASGKAEVVHVEKSGFYESYDIYSWQEFSELKAIIEESDSGIEDWVNIEENPMKAPRVIRYIYYNKHFVKKVRLTRKNIFLRDQFTCQYCGNKFTVPELQLEHVIPKAQGGKTTWANTVCSCHACNEKKGSRTPEQAGMSLIRKPFYPKFLPANSNRFRWDGNRYASWKHFISDLYWNIEIVD